MVDPAYGILGFTVAVAVPVLVRWCWGREERRRMARVALLWGRGTAAA